MKAEFVLIGGGLAILRIAQFLKESNKKFYVVVHPSHGDEILKSGKDSPVNLITQLRISGIQTYELETEAQVEKLLEEFPCKYVIGLGPRWIFSSSTLKLASRWINVNVNKIPEYLGGAHVSWQIMNDDRNLIVTFQEINNSVDRGPVLKQYRYEYPATLKFPWEYLEFNAAKAIEAFSEFEEEFLGVEIPYREIDWTTSTYWPRLKAEINGWINWTWNADQIVKFIKAFSLPYGGARTFMNQSLLVFFDAEIAQEVAHHPFAAGLILRRSDDEIFVATIDAILKLNLDVSQNQFQDLNFVGNRLFTPSNYLDQSMMTRVITRDLGKEKD